MTGRNLTVKIRQRINSRAVISVLAAFAVLLSSCVSSSEEKHESCIVGENRSNEIQEDKERIGIYRQGLSKNCVLSEKGIYGMQIEKDMKYLYYCDLDSDTFIKVCGRPDCSHDSRSCDAYIPKYVMWMTYYDGHLYYVDPAPELSAAELGSEEEKTSERRPYTLYRMDTKGRNRKAVATLFRKEELTQIEGHEDEIYTNGCLEITLSYRGNGTGSGRVRKYLSLSSPGYLEEMSLPLIEGMTEAQIVGAWKKGLLILYREGTENGVSELCDIYCWSPETGTASYVGKAPWRDCQYEEDGAYCIEDGVICRWDYQESRKEVLYDTGFSEGNSIQVYPDCLMITDSLTESVEGIPNIVRMRFYSRSFEDLGECRMECKEGEYTRMVFWGETKDRILLCNDYLADGVRSLWNLPAYYIEKSDFGTGEIRLHEYHFPEE